MTEVEEYRFEDFCCNHEHTLKEGGFVICAECGLEIQTIFNYEQTWKSCLNDIIRNGGYSIRKQDDRNIYKDVERFGLCERVIEVANELYCMVTETKNYRGLYRKAIIFATLFYAMKIEDKNEKIKNLFHLDKKTIIKGIKLINLCLPKSIPIKTNYVSEQDLLREYILCFDWKSTEEDANKLESGVLDLLQQLKNKSSLINRSRPQSVICSAIYYHLTKRLYITIPIEDYAKKINLSTLTIQKLSKEFDKILHN